MRNDFSLCAEARRNYDKVTYIVRACGRDAFSHVKEARKRKFRIDMKRRNIPHCNLVVAEAAYRLGASRVVVEPVLHIIIRRAGSTRVYESRADTAFTLLCRDIETLVVIEVKGVKSSIVSLHLRQYGYAESKTRGIRSVRGIMDDIGVPPRRLPDVTGLIYHVIVFSAKELGEREWRSVVDIIGLGSSHISFIDSVEGPQAAKKTVRVLRNVLSRLYSCRVR